MAKMKAWREASRSNTVNGTLSKRQIKAFVRTNPGMSNLLHNMLTRAFA